MICISTIIIIYFGPLKDGLGFQVFRMARCLGVGFDPADIFTSPESPAPQTDPAQIQPVTRSTPQEYEAPRCSYLTNIHLHNLFQ